MPASSMSASTASMAGRFAWMSLRIASRTSRAEYRRAMANPGGRRRIVRVGAAAVAMVLVAEAAVWLLRPGERPIQPAPVSESDYFTPAQIDRGRTYSDGQLWLFVAALAAQGAALLIALLRRFGRRWWLPGTVAVGAIAVVFVWLTPVVLAPLFNKFTPLLEGSRARAQVLSLSRRAGVDVGQVYRVNASRRVRSLNAYVDGIGPTRRVVLYDNLLRRANRPELRSVVAHELGHVKHNDVPRGLAFLIIVTPLALLFVS